MARILVNPRIGVEAKLDPASRTGKNMRDILGVFNMMVYDDVAKKYYPAVTSDLPG